MFSLDPSVDSDDGLSMESIACDACDVSDYLLCSVADGMWRYLFACSCNKVDWVKLVLLFYFRDFS